MEKIIIRSYQDQDINFIINSWLKNYKFSSKFAQNIPAKIYYSYHEPIIKALINNCANHSIVATLEDAPNVILGYLIQQPFENHSLVHYVYVKFPFRSNGIAKQMFEAAGIDPDYFTHTHWTGPVTAYYDYHPNIIYNPYLI